MDPLSLTAAACSCLCSMAGLLILIGVVAYMMRGGDSSEEAPAAEASAPEEKPAISEAAPDATADFEEEDEDMDE